MWLTDCPAPRHRQFAETHVSHMSCVCERRVPVHDIFVLPIQSRCLHGLYSKRMASIRGLAEYWCARTSSQLAGVAPATSLNAASLALA